MPSLQSAKEISHLVVGKNIAACCNIIPKVISVYLWENEIKEDQEYLMVIKTSQQKYKILEKMILQNHPYDLPEIISFPIENGYPEYLNWIMKTTGK